MVSFYVPLIYGLASNNFVNFVLSHILQANISFYENEFLVLCC